MRLYEPSFPAHIGTAQLELGNLGGGRRSGARWSRVQVRIKGPWNLQCYAVLARAQLGRGSKQYGCLEQNCCWFLCVAKYNSGGRGLKEAVAVFLPAV
jgi:hypothetical protein